MVQPESSMNAAYSKTVIQASVALNRSPINQISRENLINNDHCNDLIDEGEN